MSHRQRSLSHHQVLNIHPSHCLVINPKIIDQIAPPAPPTHLKSTQDLLARFQLLPAYDKHVRPFVTPIENGQGHPPPTPGLSEKAKGKEREREPPVGTSPIAHTPGADGGDPDDDDGPGHGEKKKKNNYKHLIKGVPGSSYLLCSLIPYLHALG
jgi:hypothetical protein